MGDVLGTAMIPSLMAMFGEEHGFSLCGRRRKEAFARRVHPEATPFAKPDR